MVARIFWMAIRVFYVIGRGGLLDFAKGVLDGC